MVDIREIIEEPRMVESDDSGQVIDRDFPHRNSTKRKRSKKRRNSASSVQSSRSSNDERWEENGDRKKSDPQPSNIQKEDTPPAREQHKIKFYEDYCEVAKDYDLEFIKKYDEDLNTTLIFAGLFSAVTSAFIIQVDSQLQPDPGDETAALLRVLIYKIDNTTFGSDIPSLPQWTGPPHTMVQVQAILFSSLAASLLSAFLAMLGKQWLNRYESTDMRGSATQRGQHRQRKLDGIHGWYFSFVMESLSLMLQIALLLLGSALSRYLWETSITIASVVVVVTSFGLLFYFFILIAGTVWDTCPYQTPGSCFFRYIGPKVPGVVHLTVSTFKKSKTFCTIADIITCYRPVWSKANAPRILRSVVIDTPVALARDTFLLCKTFVLSFYCLAPALLKRLRSTPTPPEQQQTALDLRCISWTLQTSLEEPVRRSILKHLTTVAAVTDLDPTLITACFDIFVGCVCVCNGKVIVIQGLEELATISAGCFFQILRHLSATRSTPTILQDLWERYRQKFPFGADFQGLPFYQAAANIHVLARQRDPGHFWWEDYQLPDQKLITFTRCMVEAAQTEYKQTKNKRVPRWILRFALRFLSRDPPFPTSLIAECLTIIAIALGHDFSGVLISDESLRVEHVSSLIIQTLETMARDPDADPTFQYKRKAICALFPYAVHLSQGGQPGMVDALLRVGSKSKFTGFVWRCIGPYIAKLFDESSPPSWNEPIIFAAPFANWEDSLYTQSSVARWAAAVFPTPYSEDVGRSVVIALFRIVLVDSLRPHIPIYIWAWLKSRPTLPPDCISRRWASGPETALYIRNLGDLEILKSYFLLVWSEWNEISPGGLTEMKIAIREEFRGTAMRCHREDLTKRLDHILRQLDQGLEHFKEHDRRVDEGGIKWRKKQYGQLKKILQEVEGSATETLPET